MKVCIYPISKYFAALETKEMSSLP